MKRNFTIKSLIVVTAFVAIASGWTLDRYRFNNEMKHILIRHEQQLWRAEYEWRSLPKYLDLLDEYSRERQIATNDSP